MSLEGLLRELDKTKTLELEKRIQMLSEQHAADLRSKEKEIACLREEIDTLRKWLDHSALPAFNPISKRNDAMGLVKMNFGPDKPCPVMWAPGEKELLASVEREPAMMEAPGEEARTDDYLFSEPLPRGPIPEAPRFEPPSRDMSHDEKPELPAESSLEEPGIPEFRLPDLELPGFDLPSSPAPKKETSTPTDTIRKPATKSRKAAAKRPVRKTSFPSVRRAIKPRRKAAAARGKTK